MQGEKPAGKTTLFDTPSQLFVPEVVTKENIKDAVVDGGVCKVADICTGEYADGLRRSSASS